MSAAISFALPHYQFQGISNGGTCNATGFDDDGSLGITINGLPDGMVSGFVAVTPHVNPSGLNIDGAPTTPGIYEVEVLAQGKVSGVSTTVGASIKLIVEGDGYFSFYHLDYSLSPVDVRAALGIAYDATARTFSGAFLNLGTALELTLGQTLRLHALIGRSAVATRLSDFAPTLPATAPTDVRLAIRPANNFDAAPYILQRATGTEQIGIYDGSIYTFTRRPVNYFDLTIDSTRLRRLFAQSNAPEEADPASAHLSAVGQLAFTLENRRHNTPIFPVKILQPYVS